MAQFNNAYIFGFAGAVCLVCSVAVAGVSMSLQDRQLLNKERDTRSSILGALGLPEPECKTDASGDQQCVTPDLQGEQIDALWDKHVQQRFITPEGATADASLDQDADGQLTDEDLVLALDQVSGDEAPPLLGLYVRVDDGQTKSIAIPLDGVGLWGPLSGYLALDPKGTEVVGATFFAPKETPGLGAEIMEEPFKKQWQSKSIVDDDDDTETIRVVKGEASTLCPDDIEHCVDGVSGATITSRGVDAMVAQALTWYDPFLSDLRGG